MPPALSLLDGRPLLHRRRIHSHSRVSMRRFHSLSAKKKGASEKVKKLQKMCEGVSEQLSMLRQELVELKELSVGSVGEGEQSIQTVVSQLAARQEAFFRAERRHWITERQEWQKHETKLLTEIDRLHGLIGTSPGNQWTSKATESTDSEMDIPVGDNEDPTTSDLSTAIAAAISAVDEADVLSDEFQDYLTTAVNGAADARMTTGDAPVETIKSPPTGPPPTLSMGDDDIFWVHQLQEALVRKGYFCGDDDCEDYYFGEGTLSALLSFQACSGLEESGVANTNTWKALLGPDLKPITHFPAEDTKTSTDATTHIQEASPGAAAERIETSIESGSIKESEDEKFPVLAELDGGRDVHCLQVMLEIAGFSCGGEDMQWWHYGDNTINAIKTFQACNGLPQSGVADVKTWEALAGNGKSMTDVRSRVKKEQIYEEDLSNTDRVWLLGEQRWERKI